MLLKHLILISIPFFLFGCSDESENHPRIRRRVQAVQLPCDPVFLQDLEVELAPNQWFGLGVSELNYRVVKEDWHRAQRYKLNIGTMEQTHVDSSHGKIRWSSRKVRACKVPKPSDPGYTIELQLDDRKVYHWETAIKTYPKWIKFDLDTPLTFFAKRSLPHAAYRTYQYELDLKHMMQINTRTKTPRRIRLAEHGKVAKPQLHAGERIAYNKEGVFEHVRVLQSGLTNESGSKLFILRSMEDVHWMGMRHEIHFQEVDEGQTVTYTSIDNYILAKCAKWFGALDMYKRIVQLGPEYRQQKFRDRPGTEILFSHEFVNAAGLDWVQDKAAQERWLARLPQVLEEGLELMFHCNRDHRASLLKTGQMDIIYIADDSSYGPAVFGIGVDPRRFASRNHINSQNFEAVVPNDAEYDCNGQNLYGKTLVKLRNSYLKQIIARFRQKKKRASTTLDV